MTDSIAPAAGVTAVAEVVAPQAQPVSSEPSDTTVVTNASTPTTEAIAGTPGEPTSPAEPKKSRAEERIQELVAERNAAKEYAEYWRDAAIKVTRTSQSPQDTRQSTPAPKPHEVQQTAPTLDQFQYDQKAWSTAMSEWAQYQIASQTQRALQQNQQQQSQNEVLQKYTDKVETFKKDHPDFDLVTSNPKLPSLDKMAAAMVINSDMAAELTYHLAQNPEEAVRIARMNPTQQALAIGRLEGKISTVVPTQAPVVAEVKTVKTTPAQTKPNVPSVTQAPDPLEPIPAGGAVTPSPGDIGDVNEWMRLRAAEVRTRRRSGARTIK